MGSRRASHSPAPVVLTAVLLVLFSATGLMAGKLTRVLGIADMAFGARFAAPSSQSSGTTTHPASAAGPTATVTPHVISTHFVLTSLTLSQHQVAPGDHLRISVTAQDQSTQQPIEGLQVTLSAATSSSTMLFTTEPAAAVTNPAGLAMWSITIPQSTPAGTYDLKALATGPAWSWFVKAAITVT